MFLSLSYQYQILFGPKLGSGEFSDVYEVKAFLPHQDIEQHEGFSKCESDQRLHMKKYEKYRETKKARYALKHLKDEYFQSREDKSALVQAAR